jgi:chromosome segregation and condensation protein ScpB
VEKASRNIGTIQKKLLEELQNILKSYRDNGYGISKYEKHYRQICKKKNKGF